MKTQKLISGLLFTILFCFNFGSANALSFSIKLISIIKAPAQLKYVFVNEVDSTNKDILKLYDDFTYEFLFFQKTKNKPKVKREKGTYSLKKDKLVLDKETEAEVKQHSNHFVFIENKGLANFQMFNKTKKETEILYVLNNDAKYWQPIYHDPYFGDITNDKKASKKIIDKKPEYVPVRVLSDIGDNSKLTLHTNIVEDDIEPNKSSNGFISRDSLKQLKAIIIVGPVDKEWDKNSIENQKKTAKYLKDMGVQVIEFYPPNDKWESIVKASAGAHIFIYSGHGSNQGINYEIGGICLTKNIYHAQEILDNLKLHKNALILFNSVCGAAGSSAIDNNDIGKKEAIKRVSEYAYPFYKLNAGAYYANNYTGCLIPFLESFFQRKNIKSIYKAQASLYQKIEGYSVYQYDSQFEVSVAAQPSTNKLVTQFVGIGNGKWKEQKVMDFKSYDVAYVGKPNFTVVDLFKQ
jgi:hypothetical protein